MKSHLIPTITQKQTTSPVYRRENQGLHGEVTSPQSQAKSWNLCPDPYRTLATKGNSNNNSTATQGNQRGTATAGHSGDILTTGSSL